MTCAVMYGQDQPQGLFRLGADDLTAPNKNAGNEIISASRTLKNSSEVPFTVHVITREEILENGYITLVDALKSVPGIRVSQPGSAIEGETFLIRGLHGNYYCKILIDGVPVQPSVAGGMPISAQLPVRQAERIEVTFGPSSSIYGANAMAGVINIVMHGSERPVTAQADIAMGDNGQEYLNVSIGGKVGKNKNVVTYSLFGNYFSRGDMNVKKDVEGVYDPSLYDSSFSYIDAPFYRGDSTAPELGRLPELSRMLGFSVKWRGLAFQFFSMSRRTHSSIGQRTDIYSYADPTNYWGETIRRYTLSYGFSRDRFSSQTTLSWLSYRLDDQSSFGLIYPVGPSGKVFKYAASDDIFAEQLFNVIPLPGMELTAGLSFTASGNLPKTNDLTAPFGEGRYTPFFDGLLSDTVFGTFGYNPVNYSNASAFLQVYYSLGRFVFIAGDRYDHHSIYKGANNLRLALQFKARENLSVYANLSQGFRAPSPFFSYSSLAYRDGDSIYYSTVPNEGLKPEKLFAVEAGTKWKATEKVSLDASLFYHRLKKQFTRSFVVLDREKYPLATNGFLTQAYINDDTSRAELYGLQVSLLLDDLAEAVDLDGEVQFTVSKGNEVLAYPRGSIDSYRQWPVFTGQVNISLRPVDFLYLYFRNTVSTGWTKQYLPLDKEILDLLGYETTSKGYYTLDILARVFISRNFQAFFQLNNLLNAKYPGIDAYGSEVDLRYNPQYGRNFKIGLSFSLD